MTCWRFAQDHRYKLVEGYGEQGLYDREAEPSENENLFDFETRRGRALVEAVRLRLTRRPLNDSERQLRPPSHDSKNNYHNAFNNLTILHRRYPRPPP